MQQKQAVTSTDIIKAVSVVKKDGKELHRAPSDAKELAKRKILSGELKIKKDNGQRAFKRARSHVEKKPETEKPFSRRNLQETGDDRKHEIEQKQAVRPHGRSNYDNFVPAGTLKDAASPDKVDHGRPRFGDKNRKKIFVAGHGLTESILQNCFTEFGPILNIHPELDRGQGFITFATHEAAEKAIAEMHGEMVQNVILKVFMAGKPHRGDHFDDRRSFEDRRERHQISRTMNQDAPPLTEKPPPSDNKKIPTRELIEYAEEFDF